MVFRDNVDVYVMKRVNDGYGGHIEKEIYIKNIDCKISSMATEKQNIYFGNISTTALSLITKDHIDDNNLLKIDEKLYEVIKISKVFNKYIVDVEVQSV